jgi:hypothetical protein
VRYFAPGDSALTLYADIASKWDGPHSLRVTVPDMLDWRIELGSTPATVMMTALSHRLAPITWRSNAFQRVVNAVAAALLRARRIGMSGTAPNGQSSCERGCLAGRSTSGVSGDHRRLPGAAR